MSYDCCQKCGKLAREAYMEFYEVCDADDCPQRAKRSLLSELVRAPQTDAKASAGVNVLHMEGARSEPSKEAVDAAERYLESGFLGVDKSELLCNEIVRLSKLSARATTEQPSRCRRALELLRLIVGQWDEEQSKRRQSIADEPWHVGKAREII